MAYTLHLKVMGGSNLPAQDFSSLPAAVEAAVNIKASCTTDERLVLLMFVSDVDGNVIANNTDIDRVYT